MLSIEETKNTKPSRTMLVKSFLAFQMVDSRNSRLRCLLLFRLLLIRRTGATAKGLQELSQIDGGKLPGIRGSLPLLVNHKQSGEVFHIKSASKGGRSLTERKAVIKMTRQGLVQPSGFGLFREEEDLVSVLTHEFVDILLVNLISIILQTSHPGLDYRVGSSCSLIVDRFLEGGSFLVRVLGIFPREDLNGRESLYFEITSQLFVLFHIAVHSSNLH
mmetsp:Transcript_35091/g.54718  ORF Transcript_35091/g.54718 Transcript_35091/m.54718 type:complete len:218 (+) Transcript_35091:356-1009(+)